MFGSYDGVYDLIHLYTKGNQKVLIDDNTKGIIIENGDAKRTIELSEDKKLISIKNTDPGTNIEISSVGKIIINGNDVEIISSGDVKIKGSTINLESEEIMINGESLIEFMAPPENTAE